MTGRRIVPVAVSTFAVDDTPGVWITGNPSTTSPAAACVPDGSRGIVNVPATAGRYDKGDIMNRTANAPSADGMTGGAPDGAGRWRERLARRICLLDARLRTVTAEPEKGAATAEYAVVLVAATGFAALLVTILKSGTIKNLLTDIIKQALNV